MFGEKPNTAHQHKLFIAALLAQNLNSLQYFTVECEAVFLAVKFGMVEREKNQHVVKVQSKSRTQPDRYAVDLKRAVLK